MKALALLLGDAWELTGTTGSGHLRWVHTSGAMMITSKTPSDHRAAKNILATAKRAIREHAELVARRAS